MSEVALFFEKMHKIFKNKAQGCSTPLKQFIDHIAEVISNGDDDMKEEGWMLLGQCLDRVRFTSQQRGPHAWDDFSAQLKSFAPEHAEWMRRCVDNPVACFDKALKSTQRAHVSW